MHGDWTKIQTTFASALGSDTIWEWWRVNGVGGEGKFVPIGMNELPVRSFIGNDGYHHGISFTWQTVDSIKSGLYVKVDETILGPIITNP